MLKRIRRKLKVLIYRSQVKSRVSLSRTSKIDISDVFEGKNKIEPNVIFYRSRLGKYSYIGRDSEIINADIGRFVSIGPRVKFILGTHPLDYVSTHPAFYSNIAKVGETFVDVSSFEEYRYADKRGYSVVIGNDVWIGADCRIVEGVSIGDGAVILAGAVVTKSVPAYAVVGGVPAKILKYRFQEEEVKRLEAIKWWDKDILWLKEMASSFQNLNLFFEKQDMEKIHE